MHSEEDRQKTIVIEKTARSVEKYRVHVLYCPDAEIKKEMEEILKPMKVKVKG